MPELGQEAQEPEGGLRNPLRPLRQTGEGVRRNPLTTPSLPLCANSTATEDVGHGHRFQGLVDGLHFRGCKLDGGGSSAHGQATSLPHAGTAPWTCRRQNRSGPKSSKRMGLSCRPFPSRNAPAHVRSFSGKQRHLCYTSPHCNGWAFGKRSLEKGRVHEELAMPVRALNTTIPFGSRYPVPHRFASDRFLFALAFHG